MCPHSKDDHNSRAGGVQARIQVHLLAKLPDYNQHHCPSPFMSGHKNEEQNGAPKIKCEMELQVKPGYFVLSWTLSVGARSYVWKV